MREEERDRLSSYGWVDRKAGIARIPVDRAIEILAKKGLPTPQERGVTAPEKPRGENGEQAGGETMNEREAWRYKVAAWWLRAVVVGLVSFACPGLPAALSQPPAA